MVEMLAKCGGKNQLNHIKVRGKSKELTLWCFAGRKVLLSEAVWFIV